MADAITAPVTVITNVIIAPITLAPDAYQLAVREGFVGTRPEWLASLVGEPGDPGSDATVPSWLADFASVRIDENAEQAVFELLNGKIFRVNALLESE